MHWCRKTVTVLYAIWILLLIFSAILNDSERIFTAPVRVSDSAAFEWTPKQLRSGDVTGRSGKGHNNPIGRKAWMCITKYRVKWPWKMTQNWCLVHTARTAVFQLISFPNFLAKAIPDNEQVHTSCCKYAIYHIPPSMAISSTTSSLSLPFLWVGRVGHIANDSSDKMARSCRALQ